MILALNAAEWTALGTWVYTLFTGVLAIAAIVAGKAALEQLRQLRQDAGARETAHSQQIEELRRSREASLRPWVLVRRTVWDNAGRVQLVLHNIGPGPALDVSIKAAIFEYGDSRPHPEDILPTAARHSREALPLVVHLTGIVGNSGEVSVFLARPPDTADLPTTRFGVLWAHANFRDVFGHNFEEFGAYEAEQVRVVPN